MIPKEKLRNQLKAWLQEDLGSGDITSETVFSSNDEVPGEFICKAEGILAGMDIIKELFLLVNPEISFQEMLNDGTAVTKGGRAAALTGPIKDLMKCERLALNILQHLSGIATLVARYVAAVAGTRASIMDTRKTMPGMRLLEKYAVTVGGGVNHRMGLWDQVLIKDNHLAYLARNGGPYEMGAVKKLLADNIQIEVEAKDFKEVKTLLKGELPDIIMLDNMSPAEMTEIVAYVKPEHPEIELEASGGVKLETVAQIAATGVDRISVGALTHSVQALDIGFYI